MVWYYFGFSFFFKLDVVLSRLKTHQNFMNLAEYKNRNWTKDMFTNRKLLETLNYGRSLSQNQ